MFVRDNDSLLPETLRARKLFIHPRLTFSPRNAQAVAGPHGWFLPGLPQPAAMPPPPARPPQAHAFQNASLWKLGDGEAVSGEADMLALEGGVLEHGRERKANTPVPVVAKQAQPEKNN